MLHQTNKNGLMERLTTMSKSSRKWLLEKLDRQIKQKKLTETKAKCPKEFKAEQKSLTIV